MSAHVRFSLFHSPGRRPAVPASPIRRGISLIGCLISALAPTLGGCSMSFPMASLAPGAEDITGSNSPVPFGGMLDAEDRRREKAALSTALDPQGDGGTVHWENVKSGSKGAITAVGRAYPSDGKVCRAFLGDLARDTMQKTLQGTACTVAAGDWAIRDAKPFKKG